jgi:hypothetical protein
LSSSCRRRSVSASSCRPRIVVDLKASVHAMRMLHLPPIALGSRPNQLMREAILVTTRGGIAVEGTIIMVETNNWHNKMFNKRVS